MKCDIKQQVGTELLLRELHDKLGAADKATIELATVMSSKEYTKYSKQIIDRVNSVVGPTVSTMEVVELVNTYIETGKVVPANYAKDTKVISVITEPIDIGELYDSAKAVVQVRVYKDLYGKDKVQQAESNDIVAMQSTEIDELAASISTELRYAISNNSGLSMLHEYVHAGAVLYMEQNPNSSRTKEISRLYSKALSNSDKIDKIVANTYWKTDVNEFLAEAMSNTQLIYALSKIADGSNNVLTRFISSVLTMARIKKGSNLHSAVVTGFEAIVEAQNSRQKLASKTIRRLVMDVTKPLVKRDSKVVLDAYLRGIDGALGGQYNKNKHSVKVASVPQSSWYDDTANELIDAKYFEMVDTTDINDDDVYSYMQNDEEYSKLQKMKPNVVEAIKENVKYALKNSTTSLTHEMIHAGSTNFIDSNPEHVAVKRLHALYNKALRADIKSKIDAKMYYTEQGLNEYWTKSVHEFVAEALSNPRFMQALYNINVKDGNKLSTVFKEVYSTIMELLGFTKEDTIYSYALDGFIAIIEAQTEASKLNGKQKIEVLNSTVESSSTKTVKTTFAQRGVMKALRKIAVDIDPPLIRRAKDLALSRFISGIDAIIKGQYDKTTHVVTVALTPDNAQFEKVVHNRVENSYYQVTDEKGISDEDLLKYVENDPEYRALESKKIAAVEQLKEVVKEALSEPLIVLTHELIHASASRFMNSNPTHPAVVRVHNLFKKAQLPRYVGRIDTALYTVNAGEDNYWKTDVHEFLAEALTNPRLTAVLSELKVNEGNLLSTFFSELYDTIMTMLGYTKKNSIYGYALDGYLAIIEARKTQTSEEVGKYSPLKGSNSIGKAANKEVPKQYYTQMNKLVKQVIGPKVTTSQYLAFSKATLERLAVVGGQYNKGEIVLSKRPNQAALEMEAKGMFEQWYVEESPYAVQFQAMDEEQVVKALAGDPMYARLSKEYAPQLMAEMVAEWGKVNGMHTLAHEMVHAGSREFMVANPEHVNTKRIKELYKEALTNKVDILNMMGKGANEYWTRSIDEFVAEGLSNPNLVYALKNLRTKDRSRLSSVFKDLVETLLNMVGVDNTSNVYTYLMDGYVAMVESVVKPEAANSILDSLKAVTKPEQGIIVTKEWQEASKILVEAGLDATSIVDRIKKDIEDCS